MKHPATTSHKSRARVRVRRPLLVLGAAVLVVFGGLLWVRSTPALYYDVASRVAGRDISKLATPYRNISYCGTPDLAQRLDLQLPKSQPFGAPPLVINIHGGGWRTGTRNNLVYRLYAPDFLARGIAVATVGYRLSGEAPYPAQNEDVHCAVRYLMTHAAAYGYDPSRVVIMGDSAGGHLAAMEVLRRGAYQFRLVVMLYGVSDLRRQILYEHDTNAVRYLGAKARQLAQSNSPMYADLRHAPPFLIVHGTDDSIVPSDESKDFYEKLIAHGVNATYIPVSGAPHGFINAHDSHELEVRKQIMQLIVRHVY